MFKLKNYQKVAVDKLKKRIEMYLEEGTNGEVIFKAPTGSGKTFMISSLLEELVRENEDANFCVLWACPGTGDLHKQSFDSVKGYTAGNPVCTFLEDEMNGAKEFISKHEIAFFNWEKLVQKDKETGAWKNNLMKDQEGKTFINVLENTRARSTKIILVVDESHIGADSKARISEFKNDVVKPDIILEMSATPLHDHIDVTINHEDVIAEGMIKEDIIVNEGIRKGDLDLVEIDTEQLVLQKGYEKRLELLKRFKEIGSNVNPLCLIQIPNVDAGEAKKIVIKDFLRERGITEENGKLKLWCDDKSDFNKKELRRNDDETEFLIFKTAVAVGWDCPRAHILVKFREGKSETFEIQTVGRILRTPEAKSYGDVLLDNAYIFTNIKDFETKRETYSPNRIKSMFSHFRDSYTKDNIWDATQLISFYRSRQGDYNSADSSYNQFFEASFMSFFGFEENEKYLLGDANVKKLEARGLKLALSTDDTLISETVIKSKTIDDAQKVKNDQVDVKMSENDIEAAFYSIIKDNLNGLAYKRSKDLMGGAIVDVFSKFYCPFSRSTKITSIQKIVVNNQNIFAQIISDSTLEFREKLKENAGKKGEKYPFKIEPTRAYSPETHQRVDFATKSLYQPLYVLMNESGKINQLEADFLEYLEEQETVEWYWENGAELMRVNFGISYNNNLNTFQPDFIVKFKDGTVGIFDTKGVGQRVEDTKVKSEALHSYLSSVNFNRGYAPHVIGGIVIKVGSQFYFYDQVEYHDFSESHEGWENFNDVLFKIEQNVILKKKY